MKNLTANQKEVLKNKANELVNLPNSLSFVSIDVEDVCYELQEYVNCDLIASILNCKVEEFEMKFTASSINDSDKRVNYDFFINNFLVASFIATFSNNEDEEIVDFEVNE